MVYKVGYEQGKKSIKPSDIIPIKNRSSANQIKDLAKVMSYTGE